MKKNYALVLVSALALSSVAAFAGQGSAPNVRTISLDEFRSRCADPKDTDIQVAPQNIHVICAETHTGWEQVEAGSLALPANEGSQDQVSATLESEKFNVGTVSSPVTTADAKMSCQRYKQVTSRTEVSVPLSCNDILGKGFDLVAFCSSQVGAIKGVNPKLTQTTETGTVIDTCANAAPSAGK